VISIFPMLVSKTTILPCVGGTFSFSGDEGAVLGELIFKAWVGAGDGLNELLSFPGFVAFR